MGWSSASASLSACRISPIAARVRRVVGLGPRGFIGLVLLMVLERGGDVVGVLADVPPTIDANASARAARPGLSRSIPNNSATTLGVARSLNSTITPSLLWRCMCVWHPMAPYEGTREWPTLHRAP